MFLVDAVARTVALDPGDLLAAGSRGGQRLTGLVEATDLRASRAASLAAVPPPGHRLPGHHDAQLQQ